MGRLAEMQRRLLEVCARFGSCCTRPQAKHSTMNALPLPGGLLCYTLVIHLPQQMMGPEAMGTANANLHWSDEKVCRNFLCGTCPHTLFTNTVRFHRVIYHYANRLRLFVNFTNDCLVLPISSSAPARRGSYLGNETFQL